jgi:hypothetical protein
MITIMMKVILRIQCDNDNIKYTNYNRSKYYNMYYGCVQAFQNGSNKGLSKHYYNDNGILKIETSEWKNKDIPQTPETRSIKENWDENKKTFVIPEICLKKIKSIQSDDVITNNDIIIYFNNVRYVLKDSEHISFGSIDDPKPMIYY